VKRGRPSASALTTVVIGAGSRTPPAPPAELTDAQAQVWRDTVGGLPGDWLERGAHPILVQYCRHVCRARLIEIQLQRFEAEWLHLEGGLERLDKLLHAAERESRAVLATARALRITPQAMIAPRTAGRKLHDYPPGPRPWE
jgi:hypothetical protein